MFYDDFQKYNSEYERGVMRVSICSSELKITNDPFDIRFQKTFGNYDLFFNRSGRLLWILRFENREKSKVLCGYNSNGLLIVATKVILTTGDLLSMSKFVYDDMGRIETETVHTNYFTIEKHIHSYANNKEKIFMTNDDEETDEYTIHITYDDKQRVIEEKAIRNEDELVYWDKREYDNDDNIVKEISLDEDGDPCGVCEYSYFKKGPTSGYYCKSEESNHLWEYSYTFNKKGHWTNQIQIRDGDPRYFCDRTIHYY